MPLRYKLRLGDGTSLSVDIDGLRSWAAQDPRALAQAVGNQQWRPIGEILIEEENAVRLLRALVPPQPKKDVPAPEWELPHEPAFGQQRGFGEPAFGAPVSYLETPALQERAPFDLPAPPEPPAAPHEPAYPPPPSYAAPAADSRPFPEPAAALPRENLQVLADETTSPDASDAGGPSIRLKPLDDDGGFRSAWSEDGEAHDDDEHQPRASQREGPLVELLAPLGHFLSRVLAPLGGVLDRWSERRARSAESSFPSLSDASQPQIEAGPSWRETLREKLGGAWSGLAARFKRAPAEAEPDADAASDGEYQPATEAAFEAEPEPEFEAEPEPEREREREPEVEPEPVKRAPLPPRIAAPPAALDPAPRVSAPRAPVKPPAPLSTIPVVPLAEPVRPQEPEDVYEEDEPSDFAGPLLFWAKRLLLLGVFAAVGYLAYRERDVWFPKAGNVGQTIFRAIDQKAHSRERSERQRQALAAAVPKLPHLTEPTILLVFAQSPTGVTEASDVFEVTREATERGLDKLPAGDAEELRALEQELAATLRPPERRRLEEYDEARARRGVFPFENPYAMDLVAKGARALPPERLERLRALTEQAVAAGLAATSDAAKDPSTR